MHVRPEPAPVRGPLETRLDLVVVGGHRPDHAEPERPPGAGVAGQLGRDETDRERRRSGRVPRRCRRSLAHGDLQRHL